MVRAGVVNPMVTIGAGVVGARVEVVEVVGSGVGVDASVVVVVVGDVGCAVFRFTVDTPIALGTEDEPIGVVGLPWIGLWVGDAVGLGVGDTVGLGVGDSVGFGVGVRVDGVHIDWSHGSVRVPPSGDGHLAPLCCAWDMIL